MALPCSKKISTLLRKMKSKKMNCLRSFQIRVCENKDFCNVVLPSEDTKILAFSQYPISGKTPSIFYVVLESLIEKIDGCKNKPEKSSTTKASEHIPSGFSMSTVSSFKDTENKRDGYRGNIKYCLKKCCESIREHAMKITDFNKKKILTKKQQE